MTWQEHIHADPDPAVAGGKPVIRGTQLAVGFVPDLLAVGWTGEQLTTNYPGRTDVALRAVFAHAAAALQDQTFHPLRPGAA